MGMYVYRVTAKKVVCSDGKEAWVAKYAYKPYLWDRKDGDNAKMDFRSGCPASRRMVAALEDKGIKVDRITLGCGPVYENLRNWATFYDDCNLGVAGRLPRIAGVYAPDFDWDKDDKFFVKLSAAEVKAKAEADAAAAAAKSFRMSAADAAFLGINPSKVNLDSSY